MFKKYKQFIMGFLIGAMLFSGISVFAETRTINAIFNNIKLSLDGVLIDLKDANGNPIEIFSVDGATYLPVRTLSETLNLTVKYNETTNTVELMRKEDDILMSETIKTINVPNDKVTYRRDENDLLITTQHDVDYIAIGDIEAYVFSKYNDDFNTYLFKYDEETNTGYITHHQINNKITKEEAEKNMIPKDKSKTDIVFKDIPCFKIKTRMILIKYDYYLENIKPLFL